MGKTRKVGRWGVGLALGLACALPADAEAQIGILAGYNRDTLAEFLPENGFDLTDITDGYHVGVFLNVNLATFSIRPALIYHRIPELVAMAGDEQVRFDIDMVEIPLDFRIRSPCRPFSPTCSAGPS